MDADQSKITLLQCANMMEETFISDFEASDFEDEELQLSEDIPLERWAPLGAASNAQTGSQNASVSGDAEHYSQLQDEQEQLNNSLFALTTHFAHVQFRLKQIVLAPTEQKEELLLELEAFAFKGIPDVQSMSASLNQISSSTPSSTTDVARIDSQNAGQGDNEERCCDLSKLEPNSRLIEQRNKQFTLIKQLKGQLEDLETYAYETGEADLPSCQVMEKQNVIIDRLKDKLHIDLDGQFNSLGSDELREVVDRAIGRIVNPAQVKEKLVDQLKTQIVDLERFIDFLQGDSTSPASCSCAYKKSLDSKSSTKNVRRDTMNILRQALSMLQLFTLTQLGCGSREFRKNVLKRTTKGNHWGDLRARLEISVELVGRLASEDEMNKPLDSEYTSDTEESVVMHCNRDLTQAVRKQLATSLRDLLQHGLMEVGQSTSLMPSAFGCFSGRRGHNHFSEVEGHEVKMMHAWQLVVKYYELKHGREYNDTTARKLSQSFALDMVGGKAVTVKQTLLSAIEGIMRSHTALKRSYDSQFKAFICIALNESKLVPWLRLLLRTSSLIEYYYQPWSYVMKTGFDDTLIALDSLSKYDFRLPVNLAIRPFQNIKDAF